MTKTIISRALFSAIIAMSGTLLAGCNDEKAASGDQPDQARIDKYNATTKNLNAAKNAIK